jgi:hypothetical protein
MASIVKIFFCFFTASPGIGQTVGGLNYQTIIPIRQYGFHCKNLFFVFLQPLLVLGEQLGIKLPNYNTNKAIWLPL